MKLRYKGGYNYQVHDDYTHILRFVIDGSRDLDFVEFRGDILIIRKGYAWDGPSGPMIDTPSSMRGSLVHDALYQLMRDGVISRSAYREKADRELRLTCLEDGMFFIRAWYMWLGVRLLGKRYASPNKDRPIITTP